MDDSLPTVWEGTAHTFAKHQILQAYLNAWMPIMSRQSQSLGLSEKELLFVDGFGGPGYYKGGEDGSPVLALKLVLTHSHDFHIPVRFLFIEQVKKRYELLKEEVEQYGDQISKSRKIKCVTVEQGDCETILNRELDAFEKRGENIGPAFFFLDQFGYSDISMRLIQRIMQQPLCEVFSYLNWDHMKRFVTDETKWPSITKAFGGDEWKKALALELKQRDAFMLNTYKNALKKKAGAKYVWHFAMCDENDKLIYWLFFCTHNLRGLEEMKRAMWKVDRAGGFRFSDKDDPSQLNLFEDFTLDMLAGELASNLKQSILTVSQVKEYVLTETPAYLCKPALKILEDKELLKIINPPPKRRKGTFPDERMKVKFTS